MKTLINYALLITLSYLFNDFTLAQDILWKKNFGLSSADDFGKSVIETTDGSIVVAGYTGSYGAGGNDIWLIKTTPEGDTLWTRTYGEIGEDMAFVVKQTEDGGFIIAGASESFGSNGMLDGCLIKMDELGNQEWVKAYGTTHDDYFYSLEITDDGGYILAGERDAYPEGDSDVWIVKTDSTGEFQWEKIYGSNAEDDRGYSIIKSQDGGYVVGGQKACDGFMGCNGWLLKFDIIGDTTWSKSYNVYDSFRSMIQLNNGDYVITGRVNGGIENWNVSLLKTDSLGNVEWEKTYDYANEPDYGYSVQQTSDGGYIIAGGASPPDIEQRGWIIRTDSIGEIIWTKFINSYTESLYGSSTVCYSVVQAANGDYIIAGHQTQVTFQQEVMLLRISSDIVPVELTSFTATAQQNNVTLNWQTATETNNIGFEMQRSQMSNVNGQTDWQVIGFVPGFGTTTEPKSYTFTDENLSAGKYLYRLKQIDFDGSFEYSNTVEVEINSPIEFTLEQNYPNPFNPTTKIKYTLPSVTLRQAQSDILVSLKVFDVLGNEIATLVNEPQQPSSYEVEFNVGQAISLSSGVYYYQLRVGSFVETKKMILLR